MPDYNFQFAVGPERADDFAAAIGAAGRGRNEVPPTYAMALVGSELSTLLSAVDVDPGNDTVLHTSQRFDYTRQLRPGEDINCRLSMTEPREQLHGRTLQLVCDFTAADGTHVLTTTTSLLITRNDTGGR